MHNGKDERVSEQWAQALEAPVIEEKSGLHAYREELLANILSRKQSFTDTSSKRYIFYLGKFLTISEVVLEPEVIRKSAAAFKVDVQELFHIEYISKMLRDIKLILDESAKDPELGFFPGERARSIAADFMDAIMVTFVRNASACVDRYVKVRVDALNSLAVRFRDDMRPRVDRLNVDIVDLYSLMHRSMEDYRCKECEDEDPNTVRRILDAFGRGLLHPIEVKLGIENSALDDFEHYPRLYCGPTLAALKSYILGTEKYEVTNRKMLKSIYKFCAAEEKFQREKLSRYFEEEHVKQYILAYILHILQVLEPEHKRMAFMQVIQNELTEIDEDLEDAFTEARLYQLLETWAHYVYEHRGIVSGKKKAQRILQTYLPDLEFEEEAPSEGENDADVESNADPDASSPQDPSDTPYDELAE